MKYIIDFYKELDMVNLIVFWGTIIVVILLLTFSIILANKNKKLKYILESKGIDIDNYEENDDELAIKKDFETQITEKEEQLKNEENLKKTIYAEEINEDIPILKQEIVEEKFTPEEHIMEYENKEENKIINNYYQAEIKQTTNNDYRDNINRYQNENNDYEQNNNIEKQQIISKKTTNELHPYNNTNYKELQSRQISPIGITKKENLNEKEIVKAKELHTNLNYEDIKEKEIHIPNINSIERQRQIAEEIRRQKINEEKPRGNYLEEISKSLSKIANNEGLNRTEYELKQEEDAIISYKELMEKKDSIQTIDEEEAVISIEELIAKKKEQEKLYNITNDAEDNEFINELKNFKSDL